MNSFLCIIVNSLRMRLVFPLLNFTCTWLNQKVKRRQKYWMCVLRNGAIRNHGHPPLNIGGGHGLTVRIRVTRFIYLCYCVSRAARTCSDRLPFYPVWRREQHAGITNRAAIYIYKSDCAHTHTLMDKRAQADTNPIWRRGVFWHYQFASYWLGDVSRYGSMFKGVFLIMPQLSRAAIGPLNLCWESARWFVGAPNDAWLPLVNSPRSCTRANTHRQIDARSERHGATFFFHCSACCPFYFS